MNNGAKHNCPYCDLQVPKKVPIQVDRDGIKYTLMSSPEMVAKINDLAADGILSAIKIKAFAFSDSRSGKK